MSLEVKPGNSGARCIIIEQHFSQAQADSFLDLCLTPTHFLLALCFDEPGFLHHEGHEDVHKSQGHEHDHEGCHGAGRGNSELVHGKDEDDARYLAREQEHAL